MQLTKNFKSEEFGVISNNYQMALIKILAYQLQALRDIINHDFSSFKLIPGKDIGMKITSGIRTQADYDRLKSSGYNPSKTSDHFCGLQLDSKPTLGAADIQFTNFDGDYKGLYKSIIRLNGSNYHFGQMILEYNPNIKNYWLHVGNHPNLIFNGEIADVVHRETYLYSFDNGKSYKIYKGDFK